MEIEKPPLYIVAAVAVGGRADARVGCEPGQVRKEAALSGTGFVPSCFRPPSATRVLRFLLDFMAFMLVKVVPGARRTRIVGRYGDALKVQVAAPPEAGKANQAVIKLLADALNVPLARFSIGQGRTQPCKRIVIAGVDQPTLDSQLKSLGY